MGETGQPRGAKHLDRVGRRLFLRQTLLPPPLGQGTPCCSQDVGCRGVASSCAPCWLRAGTQGMRVSEQEGLKAAESQSQGLAGSCIHTFRRSCGKAEKPRFNKHFVERGGGGAPMNHETQKGLSGLLPRA